MRRKPESCAGCPCESHGTDFSAVEGTCANGVLRVAEASGEAEQRDCLPLRPYAPAGSLVERIDRRMGLDRQQFATTNVLRCRPRNNWLERAPWEYAAISHCRGNLDAAIGKYRPRAIMAMGGIALRELTGMAGNARGVSHLAGYVLPFEPRVVTEGTEGDASSIAASAIPVIPNFHPAFLRRGKASYQGVYARIQQRAINVAAGRDRGWLWNIDPQDRSTHGPIRYQVHPSLDEARDFAERVDGNRNLTLSYDLETSESASLDEDAREGFADTRITLVQFSLGAGEGIAFPWQGGYREIAGRILRSENVKTGHNVWLFDNKVLRAAGEREGLDLAPRGVVHDTLQMFHHWQPDLPAHLQFAAQFVSFPFPWKHLAGAAIEFYGCADVDATLRLHGMLEATLRRDGLWGDAQRGYLGQMLEVRPVLARMEDRGVPIDDAARVALGAEFAAAQRELGAELAAVAPRECSRVHPKEGYKGVPPEVKAWIAERGLEPIGNVYSETVSKLLSETFTDGGDEESDGQSYHYDLRDFLQPQLGPDGNLTNAYVVRWCRVYDFNPNSAQQLLSYMKARGHKVPKSRKSEDAEGNAKDTTEKKELVRLARKHDDKFYLKVIEFRELAKARGTYVDGFKPQADGCVHTTFTFATGTGQLSSRNPNTQNFSKHGRLSKALRRMIAVSDGEELAELDYRAFHVLTTGFEAESANWMRLARLDMHSFVAWHFLRLPGADALMGLSDEELRERLDWFKSDPQRKWVRDKQAKPSDLGIGFGMGARRLYQENLEYFDGEKQAKRFHDLLKALFPEVFAWQGRVRRKAHEDQILVSKFGHARRFYEVFRWDSAKGDWVPGDQAEEAVAFLPANHAHGHLRAVMKALAAAGLDEKFTMCNQIHDALLFRYPRSLREEFLATVPKVMMAPSKVLRHGTLAPEGLWCEVEAQVGRDWASMAGVAVEVASAATR